MMAIISKLLLVMLLREKLLFIGGLFCGVLGFIVGGNLDHVFLAAALAEDDIIILR